MALHNEITLSIDILEMGQTRREFLKKLGSAAASMPALSLIPGCSGNDIRIGAKTKKPNVILVMTDDQGYGDLGCHGNPVVQTPNLDGLYSESVRLTDFHSDPTCAPTRAALLTGRYSIRTGIWHTIMGRSLMRADEVTMADIFKAGGYRTGAFGKWHLGDNFPFRPQDRGFDETLVHGGGGISQAPDYWGNDYFDDTYRHNGKFEKFEGYCTDVFFAETMKFIDSNKNRPFFCYLAPNAAHYPYNVAEKYSKPYEQKGIEAERAGFYGMITNIDENIGKLIGFLKKSGLEENTILIFMTDNGSARGRFNAGMRERKGSVYDGGHRVPCFVRWPGGGLGGGREISRLTAHIDLLPTLIELCGLQKPGDVKFDGKSIADLLQGNEKQWSDRFLCIDSQRIDHPAKWRMCVVLTERWRLINGKELYDIKADPAQQNDIAQANLEVVQRLRRAYENWWDDISQRFDEYCRIIIGSDKENPTKLCCHDWHGLVPCYQNRILQGLKANGFWALEVARGGLYELSLRRWPIEVDKPITAAIPNGKAIGATKARIKIADIDTAKEINENAHDVKFRVRLKKGKTKLQTWFIDDKGESRGAYYVYVKRL